VKTLISGGMISFRGTKEEDDVDMVPEDGTPLWPSSPKMKITFSRRAREFPLKNVPRFFVNAWSAQIELFVSSEGFSFLHLLVADTGHPLFQWV